MIFARFVVSPLSAVLALARQQKLDMILQGLFVLSAFGSIAAGAVSRNFLVFLIALTASQTAIYALYFFVSRHFSRRIGTS